MHTIWKFDVLLSNDLFTVELPLGARFLDVQVQNGSPQMWFLLNPAFPKEERRFMAIGTGHPVEDAKTLLHLGTFQLYGGKLVVHLFEKAAAP